MCNFLGSVSQQQRFKTADQCYSSVTAQSFIWQRIVHPWGVKVGKSQRRGLNPPWLPLFIGSVSSPLSMPNTHWAIQVGGLFVSPEVLTLVHGFSFVRCVCVCVCVCVCAFPFLCLLATTIWTLFSYSNYLAVSYKVTSKCLIITKNWKWWIFCLCDSN